MSSTKVLELLEKFCKDSSGNTSQWEGSNGSYQWSLGKATSQGVVNGVVRKLAGTDISGRRIWVVAGSFKIAPDGEILRFTGLSKKTQSMFKDLAAIEKVATEVIETV